MVIGLAGKYCSGKNRVAKILEEYGYPSIDEDKLGHKALDAQLEQIKEAFGSGVIALKDGKELINRKTLGAIVFADKDELEKLERISHPWMIAETEKQIKDYTSKGAEYIILNAAILYRMKLDRLCDVVIWVDAPLCSRIKRARKRDKAGFFQILKRIYVQRQLKPKPSAESVDTYRVGNNSDYAGLERKVELVLEQIAQKGRNGR